MALDVAIEAAQATDHLLVQGFLAAVGLPTEGLADQFPGGYAVAQRRSALIGVAGLEAYGAAGLLRSLAVAEGSRAQGIGRLLVENRLEFARRLRLSRVYLLTTTAADYFERLAFTRAVRGEVPAELSRSPEFASVCPASATCLMFEL